jgi:hypothetical protein
MLQQISHPDRAHYIILHKIITKMERLKEDADNSSDSEEDNSVPVKQPQPFSALEITIFDRVSEQLVDCEI